ncbi:hypothetical protein SDC9_166450 [bioreactor metagenome]|uniref:Uncharacterized protein n=1 Tax=bioreactor metagenome TaxID=1076179 RepID=A0A645G4L4_9ZZZZ
MLPADHAGYFFVFYDLVGIFFDIAKSFLRIAETGLKIAAVKHADIEKVFILIGTVGLNAERMAAHFPAGKPCSRPIGCGVIIGRAEQNDLRLFVFTVASDKIQNVLIHPTTPVSF